MTIPNLLFAFLISTLLGLIYHVIRGGNGWRLLLYTALSVAGFFATHFLSKVLGWGLYQIGGLETGLGAIGSVFFLILGDWLLRR